MRQITLNTLPKNLEELKAMPQAALTDPEEGAALTVAALARYPQDPAAAAAMLDYLRGPRPLNGMDKQFLKDRWRKQCGYLPGGQGRAPADTVPFGRGCGAGIGGAGGTCVYRPSQGAGAVCVLQL